MVMSDYTSRAKEGVPMRLEMIIGANARQRYLIDGEEVPDDDFLKALQRRKEPLYISADWELNGESIDPEILAESLGLT